VLNLTRIRAAIAGVADKTQGIFSCQMPVFGLVCKMTAESNWKNVAQFDRANDSLITSLGLLFESRTS